MNLRDLILQDLCGNCTEEVLEEGIFNQDANKYEIIEDGKSTEYKNQRAWLKALEGAEDGEHSTKGAQDSVKEILEKGGEVELYLPLLKNGRRPKATAKVTLISSRREVKTIKKAAAAADSAKYKISIKHNPRTNTVDILMGNKVLVTLPNPTTARDAFKAAIGDLNKIIAERASAEPAEPVEASSTGSESAEEAAS